MMHNFTIVKRSRFNKSGPAYSASGFLINLVKLMKQFVVRKNGKKRIPKYILQYMKRFYSTYPIYLCSSIRYFLYDIV